MVDLPVTTQAVRGLRRTHGVRCTRRPNAAFRGLVTEETILLIEMLNRRSPRLPIAVTQHAGGALAANVRHRVRILSLRVYLVTGCAFVLVDVINPRHACSTGVTFPAVFILTRVDWV